MERRTDDFCVTSKLRGQDAVCVNGETKRVELFIQSNPLNLWDAIHSNGSKISLIRTTYAQLKKAVEKINPALVEKVNKEHNLHNATRKINKEMNTGVLGTTKSTFKKLNK